MRRRRWGLPRYTWWLLLILGLSVAPLIASAFLALGVVVLTAAVGIAPGIGPGDSEPAPAPTPGLWGGAATAPALVESNTRYW